MSLLFDLVYENVSDDFMDNLDWNPQDNDIAWEENREIAALIKSEPMDVI